MSQCAVCFGSTVQCGEGNGVHKHLASGPSTFPTSLGRPRLMSGEYLIVLLSRDLEAYLSHDLCNTPGKGGGTDG